MAASWARRIGNIRTPMPITNAELSSISAAPVTNNAVEPLRSPERTMPAAMRLPTPYARKPARKRTPTIRAVRRTLESRRTTGGEVESLEARIASKRTMAMLSRPIRKCDGLRRKWMWTGSCQRRDDYYRQPPYTRHPADRRQWSRRRRTTLIWEEQRLQEVTAAPAWFGRVSATSRRASAFACLRASALRTAGRSHVPLSSSSLPSCPARDEQPSLPARCAAPGRRPNRPGVDRAARDHPGDHRVGVPHLAGPKLIASPDGSRDLRDDVEHATSTVLVGGQSLRTVYGFGDVRNIPAAPEPDLVAEDPKSACPATADRALGHDAPVLAAPVVDRRLLDDVRRPLKRHLEGGVVEITRRTPLQPRHDRLVRATVEPDEMPSGAERQPVQVHCRRLSSRVAGERVAVCLHIGEYRSGRDTQESLTLADRSVSESRSARCLIPRSILLSMRSDPGSIGSMARRAPSAGSRKRLRLINRVPPSRGSNTNVQTQFPSSERHARTRSDSTRSILIRLEPRRNVSPTCGCWNSGRTRAVLRMLSPSRFSIQSYV